MGGMVTIAARLQNKDVIAFKTSTNFFQAHMNTPLIFNESFLTENIEKYDFLCDNALPEEKALDYDSRKGILAPYEYGMILIDYFGRTLLSANNYAPMICGNSRKLLEEYADFLPNKFVLKITNFATQNISVHNIKDGRFHDIQEVHLIDMALKNNAVIKHNDVELTHNGTIDSVLEGIYKISLQGQSIEQQLETIANYLNQQKKPGDFTFSLADYSNISFEYPDFKIVEGEGAEDCEMIYNYLKNNEFVLSDLEQQTWQEFLKKD